ncbi:MAG: hypothetical protein ACM3ZU_13750 [Bacteroidota bacterium]
MGGGAADQTSGVGQMGAGRKDESARIMTVPDEITEHEFVTVTGNKFVSLPESDAWGRVLSATFPHAGCGV